MSLSKIWNELQYKMASLGLYEPQGVRQELMKQGWTFETQTLPVVSPAVGIATVHAVTIAKTPEGVSTLIDDAAMARYDAARQQAVDKIFNRAPAP